MTDKDRGQPNNRPYAYDFDSDWDVEKALHQKQESYQNSLQPETRSTNPRRRLPRGPVGQGGDRERIAPRRRKHPKKTNTRGIGVLVVLALIALGILVGFIALIVSAFSDEEASSPNTAIVNESEGINENDVPVELSPLMQLVERADRVAAGYDYDGAVDVLREYGPDWEQQPELIAARDRYISAKEQAIRWEDTASIPQISFRSLVVDPQRAFTSENAGGYQRNMITVTEFKGILEQLYANGYVLVSFRNITRYGMDMDGEEAYLLGNIYLPEGKKPLVIAQDDLNYYEYMVDGDGDRYPDGSGDGFASRLVLDENGDLACEYYSADGKLQIGEYDLIPILESFIEEHPDFSYRGARGVVAITGYQGVFGYRTHPEWELILGEEAYDQEVSAARELAKTLRAKGWEIASHGYSHYSYDVATTEEIDSDIRKWENQVQPIVGDSDIFVFLYGYDIDDEESYYSGDVYRKLYKAGYRFFVHDSVLNPWTQLTDDYVRQSRRMIDGDALWYHPETLTDLFDATLITDPERPATQLVK